MQVGLEFSSPQSASMGSPCYWTAFHGHGTDVPDPERWSELPMLKTMGTTLDGNFAAFSCELTGEDIKMIKPGSANPEIFAERAAQ